MCHGYTNLSSADRKITQIASSFLCDNTLVFGWYRFNGDAGTRMATTCPSFTLGRCAALRQGWLRGTHPNAEEGEVSRKVCFTFKTCCSRTVHVKVKNCGSYYVYRLQPPPDCPYRYCGADWTKLKQPSFPFPHSTPACLSLVECRWWLYECWQFYKLVFFTATGWKLSQWIMFNSNELVLPPNRRKPRDRQQ